MRTPAVGHPIGQTHGHAGGARQRRSRARRSTRFAFPDSFRRSRSSSDMPDERLSIRHDSGSGAALRLRDAARRPQGRKLHAGCGGDWTGSSSLEAPARARASAELAARPHRVYGVAMPPVSRRAPARLFSPGRLVVLGFRGRRAPRAGLALEPRPERSASGAGRRAAPVAGGPRRDHRRSRMPATPGSSSRSRTGAS